MKRFENNMHLTNSYVRDVHTNAMWCLLFSVVIGILVCGVAAAGAATIATTAALANAGSPQNKAKNTK